VTRSRFDDFFTDLSVDSLPIPACDALQRMQGIADESSEPANRPANIRIVYAHGCVPMELTNHFPLSRNFRELDLACQLLRACPGNTVSLPFQTFIPLTVSSRSREGS
jgi:hypothetical protein